MALLAAGLGVGDVARLGVALTVLGLWLVAAAHRSERGRRSPPGE